MDIDEYKVDISNNEDLVDGLQEIDGGYSSSCMSAELKIWELKLETCLKINS